MLITESVIRKVILIFLRTIMQLPAPAQTIVIHVTCTDTGIMVPLLFQGPLSSFKALELAGSLPSAEWSASASRAAAPSQNPMHASRVEQGDFSNPASNLFLKTTVLKGM